MGIREIDFAKIGETIGSAMLQNAANKKKEARQKDAENYFNVLTGNSTPEQKRKAYIWLTSRGYSVPSNWIEERPDLTDFFQTVKAPKSVITAHKSGAIDDKTAIQYGMQFGEPVDPLDDSVLTANLELAGIPKDQVPDMVNKIKALTALEKDAGSKVFDIINPKKQQTEWEKNYSDIEEVLNNNPTYETLTKEDREKLLKTHSQSDIDFIYGKQTETTTQKERGTSRGRELVSKYDTFNEIPKEDLSELVSIYGTIDDVKNIYKIPNKYTPSQILGVQNELTETMRKHPYYTSWLIGRDPKETGNESEAKKWYASFDKNFDKENGGLAKMTYVVDKLTELEEDVIRPMSLPSNLKPYYKKLKSANITAQQLKEDYYDRIAEGQPPLITEDEMKKLMELLPNAR